MIGNEWRIPLSDSAHVTWTSGLYYAVAFLAGPWWGGFAAAIATSKTLIDSHHPYHLIVEVIAAVAVGYAARLGLGAFAACVRFWILAGPLLIAALHYWGLSATSQQISRLIAVGIGSGLLGGFSALLLVRILESKARAFGFQRARPEPTSLKIDFFIVVFFAGVLPLYFSASYRDSALRALAKQRTSVFLAAQAGQVASCLDRLKDIAPDFSRLPSWDRRRPNAERIGSLLLAPGITVMLAQPAPGKLLALQKANPDTIDLPSPWKESSNDSLAQPEFIRIAPATACGLNPTYGDRIRLALMGDRSNQTYGDVYITSPQGPGNTAILGSALVASSRNWQNPAFDFFAPIDINAKFKFHHVFAATRLSTTGIRVVVYTFSENLADPGVTERYGDELIRGIGIAVLLSACCAALGYQWIVRPIQQLQHYLDSWRGDFNPAEVKRVQSLPLELGRLWNSALLLHQRVAESHTALRRAEAEALANTRQRTDFITHVSHEIRTPLNALLGLLPALRGDPLTAKQEKVLAIAETSGTHLANILNDVLDFARIEYGTRPAQIQSIATVTMIEEHLYPFVALAAEKQLPLYWSLAKDVPSGFDADPSRIRQILSNLISNAVKNTTIGSIRLFIHFEPESIEARSGQLTLEVIDTGCGMTISESQSVFKPFVQVRRPEPEIEGTPGSGLGLTIVQKLLKAMDGRIEIESLLGVGTKVRVRLPISSVIPALPPLDVDAVFLSPMSLSTECLRAHLRYLGCRIHFSDGSEDTYPANAVFFVASTRIGGSRGMAQSAIVTSRLQGGAVVVFYDSEPGGRAPIKFDSYIFESYINAKKLEFPPSLKTLRVLLAKGSTPDKLAPTAGNQSIAPAKPLRILVAEDVAASRLVMELLLQRLGYMARIVDNGQLAWEALLSESFDVAFLDLRMPGIDGHTLAKQIKTSAPSPPVLVALTASAFQFEQQKCLESGFDEFLSKPIVESDVSRIIRALPNPPKPQWKLANFLAFRSECGDSAIPMAKKILSDVEVRLKELSHNPNVPDSRDCFHALAGAAQLIGAAELGSALQTLERRALEGAPLSAAEVLATLRTAVEMKTGLDTLSQNLVPPLAIPDQAE